MIKENKLAKSGSFKGYLLSSRLKVFRVVILITVITFASTYIPEDLVPLTYLRWFFGPIFVAFVPGYCIAKTITLFRELDQIEFLSLSFGLSLSILPIIALISVYLSLGFHLVPIFLGLLGVTIVFSLIFITLDFRKWKRRG